MEDSWKIVTISSIKMAIVFIILMMCAFCTGNLTDLSDKNTTNDDLKHSVEPLVDGDTTFNGPIPYQVSVWMQLDPDTTLTPICTGALVYPKYVVTAAGCLPNDDDLAFWGKIDYYVVVGTNLGINFSINSGIPVTAMKRISYQPNQFYNGLGILQLLYPAPSEQIGLIPMSSTGTHAGEECNLGGWKTPRGATKNIQDNRQNRTVHIVENEYCKQVYRNISVKITSDMLCGKEGYEDVSSCEKFASRATNTGGPLVCNGKLMGVISCGDEGYPGVYASVAYYRQWILDAIKAFENTGTSATSVKPTQTPRPTNSPPESTTQPVSTQPTIGHLRPPVTTRPSSATKLTTHIFTYAVVVLIVKLIIMNRI